MQPKIPTRIVCAIIALNITTLSFAEVTRAAETVDFGFTRAELATQQGARQVDKRLRELARKTCTTVSPLHSRSVRHACRKDIEAQFRAQIWPAGQRDSLR